MHTISKLIDLQHDGILWLTGESCSYGDRILCDLTRGGVSLLAECFGLRDDPESFQSAWNTGTAAKPHVASAMLSCRHFQQVAIAALFRRGCEVVVETANELVGIEKTDYGESRSYQTRYELIEALKSASTGFVRTYTIPSGIPRDRTRNLHAISGRSV